LRFIAKLNHLEAMQKVRMMKVLRMDDHITTTDEVEDALLRAPVESDDVEHVGVAILRDCTMVV
jgi:hypothetical protein